MTSKAATNTSAVDSRKELSELIKRKAELSVNEILFGLFTFFGIKFLFVVRPNWNLSRDKSLPSKDPI
jgi:hypothetical protein